MTLLPLSQTAKNRELLNFVTFESFEISILCLPDRQMSTEHALLQYVNVNNLIATAGE